MPSNLLFFVSILFLLLVAVQLSFEVSGWRRARAGIAEDLALLRSEVNDRTAFGEPPRPGQG